MTLNPQILFVGVGNMGAPMAANLLRAGYSVSVLDLERRKAEDLLTRGASWAGSLAAGAATADVILCSLPGPAQVREVMLGDGGLMALARPGATIIDTSTSAVELVRELALLASRRDLEFLEAPVTNAIDGAALGRLSLFVGGEQACFERHRPLLSVLGDKLFYVGAPGNGATIKLLTNLLWFVGAAAIGEGLMLGAKAGIPLDTVWQAIRSSAGNSWVVEHDVPSIFAGHYDPSFSLELCVKDLTLIHQIAAAQGLALPMGGAARALFEQAMATYGGAAAELHVVRLVEEQAGLLLRPPHGAPLASA